MSQGYRRGALVLLAAACAAIGLAGPSTAPASADTAPAAGTPATVSADALPTAQINGVVWAQVVVGDTGYATGRFTKARPAGVAVGGSGEVTAGNIVAFSISTGRLVSSFNHSLNAQGLALAVSPDRTKIFVGGDFTSVDGQVRGHLAAFDTATGALDPAFKPAVSSTVAALQATATTVYVGGNFTKINTSARLRLGAVGATSGATLAWAPTADDRQVTAMVLTPDQSKVVVGGHFTTLSHTAAYGLGALSATTGAVLPWAVNQVIRDAGNNAAITSLSTDGTNIYGSGYVFGAGGNFEGAFSVTPDGALRWLEDCHGDTYGVFAIGPVVYTVSHAHACPTVGGFPQVSPATYQRAMAWSTAATGTVGHNTIGGYADWFGRPAPTLLHWWPTVSIGTFTGQSQGAWSVTGNASYVVLGGEFPRVNGVAQQGLVRFAVPALAPNRVGSRVLAAVTPTVTSPTRSGVRLQWRETWDQDNQSLTYAILRDGGPVPIYVTTARSSFWALNQLTYDDIGLAPGSTHTYRIRVTDPFGNAWSTPTVTVAVHGKASVLAGIVRSGKRTVSSHRTPSGVTNHQDRAARG